MNKNTNNTVFSLINTDIGVIINNNVYTPIIINSIGTLYDKHGNVLYNGTSNIFNANGMQSVDQDKVLNPEAWTTNGGSINLINLLKNAAIYVAGGFERVEANVNNTTVIDNPDNIIFSRTGRFLAKKDSVYYTHWNSDVSKNIASTSRYGIETDNGVVPFNNQMYKFIDQEDIYIAICINGFCSMEKLTLE